MIGDQHRDIAGIETVGPAPQATHGLVGAEQAVRRDAADSERVALRAVYGETNKGLCKALVARDAQKAKA